MGRKKVAAEPEQAKEEPTEPSAPSRPPKNPHNLALKKALEKGVAAKAAAKEEKLKAQLLLDDGQCSMTLGDLMEEEKLSLPEALEVQKQLQSAAEDPELEASRKAASIAAKETAKDPKPTRQPKSKAKAKAKATAAPVPMEQDETQVDDPEEKMAEAVAEPKRKHADATQREPANEFLRRKKQRQREQEDAKQREAAAAPAGTPEPAAKRKHPQEPDYEKDIEELMDELDLEENKKEAAEHKDNSKNKRRKKKKHSKPPSSVVTAEDEEKEEDKEEHDMKPSNPAPPAMPPPATRASYKRSDAFCHEEGDEKSLGKGAQYEEGSTIDGSMSELLESPLRCTCHNMFEGNASSSGIELRCCIIMRLGNSASQVGANMDYKKLLGMVTQLQVRLEKAADEKEAAEAQVVHPEEPAPAEPAPASKVTADDENGDGGEDLDGEPMDEAADDGESVAMDSDGESAAEQAEILQEAENLRSRRVEEAKKPKEAPLLPPPNAADAVPKFPSMQALADGTIKARKKVDAIVARGGGVPDRDAPLVLEETKFWVTVEESRENTEGVELMYKEELNLHMQPDTSAATREILRAYDAYNSELASAANVPQGRAELRKEMSSCMTLSVELPQDDELKTTIDESLAELKSLALRLKNAKTFDAMDPICREIHEVVAWYVTDLKVTKGKAKGLVQRCLIMCLPVSDKIWIVQSVCTGDATITLGCELGHFVAYELAKCMIDEGYLDCLLPSDKTTVIKYWKSFLEDLGDGHPMAGMDEDLYFCVVAMKGDIKYMYQSFNLYAGDVQLRGVLMKAVVPDLVQV
ncbi:hypothetical protein AK812_SmicGene13151 [Symbiodinium microadriaticum]|uniref:Uncharacterized protein n=1 Tax=Symbiodinium microadriaticum TaxID=2951 RepID=A0A1Q9E8U4_SYMMI|nr:hypothetical protein AK812_SmicGene13151 [Symbiodinium microadriaticum]